MAHGEENLGFSSRFCYVHVNVHIVLEQALAWRKEGSAGFQVVAKNQPAALSRRKAEVSSSSPQKGMCL